MRLLYKLSAALRGGTREQLERVVDANGMRIFEQEIHDCEASIAQAKRDLSQVVAERMRLEREAGELKRRLGDKEREASALLAAGDEAEARSLASWIADNEPIEQEMIRKLDTLRDYERRLKSGLRDTIRQVEAYRRELRMARATDSAQQATARFSGRVANLGDQLSEAESSMRRIKARQQLFADSLEAMREVEASLDEAQAQSSGSRRRDDIDAVMQRLRRQAEDGKG